MMRRICLTQLIVVVVLSIGGAVAGSAQGLGMARCAQVWIIKTGSFSDDMCTTPASLGEYLKVHLNGTSLGESECAQAWVVKTGNFLDNKCTTLKASTEYIEVWPSKNKIKSAKLTSTEATFSSKGEGLAVKCKATSVGSGSSELKTDKSGTLDVLFSECKSSGLTCTGLGDTAGTISVEGEYRLRYATLSPKTVSLALLLNAFHFTCSIVLVIIRGCLGGLVEPINKSTEVLKLAYKQKGPGEQEPSKIFNEEGSAEESCQMEASINGGSYVPASEVSSQELATEESISIEA
jgi:hypothetical protein